MKDSDVFTTSTCIKDNFSEFNYHSKPLSQDILFALPYLFLQKSIYMCMTKQQIVIQLQIQSTV